MNSNNGEINTGPGIWKDICDLLSITFLMASIASTVDIKTFSDKLKRPKGVITALLCQYLILPCVGLGMAYLFKFDFSLASALVLTATCPGGMLSNIYAFIVGSDVPLSIAMTTTSSLLSFAFIPLNSFLFIELGLKKFSNTVSFDWSGMLLSIGSLIFGIIVGLFVSSMKWYKIRKALGILGTCAVLFIIIATLTTVQSSNSPVASYNWKQWLAPLILTVAGWLSGLGISLLICKMEKPSVVSVGIETSTQSTGLTFAILGLTIQDHNQLVRALSIPTAYTLITFVLNAIALLSFYCLGWVHKKDSDVKDESITFCRIVTQCKDKLTQNKIETNEEPIINDKKYNEAPSKSDGTNDNDGKSEETTNINTITTSNEIIIPSICHTESEYNSDTAKSPKYSKLSQSSTNTTLKQNNNPSQSSTKEVELTTMV